MDLIKKVEELVKEEQSESKGDAIDNLKEFFSMLLGSKLVGHIHHLKTQGPGSYAKHKALDDFHNSSGEIADTVIEIYQGLSNCLIEFDEETLVYGLNLDTLEYLSELRWAIQEGRKLPVLAKESHIQNEIDNFIALIDKTVYKLTFLT